MKKIWSPLILALLIGPGINRYHREISVTNNLPVAKNLIVITTDGFRWQELFRGADPALINDPELTPDTSLMKMLYWSDDQMERRKKLMPFIWNIVGQKGQLLGNCDYGNKFSVANLYACSYPGYNEMFTGQTDITISSNRKIMNPNTTVLEYIQGLPGFSHSVAAFTSWDVFPYILNAPRNGMLINSGYQSDFSDRIVYSQELEETQRYIADEEIQTRNDRLTYTAAMQYLQKQRPRLLYIGLGETDEFAHQKRYDLYLQQANEVDHMISDLWNWVQSTPGYRDNTIFLITTDHGRGGRKRNWSSHNKFIRGSSDGWMAILGPGIHPAGEVKQSKEYFLEQVAQTIACVLGQKFDIGDPAPPIALQ